MIKLKHNPTLPPLNLRGGEEELIVQNNINKSGGRLQ
jgi:hypothetical protein